MNSRFDDVEGIWCYRGYSVSVYYIPSVKFCCGNQSKIHGQSCQSTCEHITDWIGEFPWKVRLSQCDACFVICKVSETRLRSSCVHNVHYRLSTDRWQRRGPKLVRHARRSDQLLCKVRASPLCSEYGARCAGSPASRSLASGLGRDL